MSDQLFEKIQRGGFMALSATAIFPFLVLCFYNQPLGVHEWDWITHEAGRFGGIDFWAYQKSLYLDSTGRFSSNAMMGLIPFCTQS